MSQYLLVNRIKVQGANTVAGFTWGFPAITHFLGFTHNLSRKLGKHKQLSDIQLSGCAVIAHSHQVHTYGFNQFVQSRNPSFQYKEQTKNKVGTPPIIEEGKMDMEVSLLISCEGNIGNREDELVQWLDNTCQLQRLAGGTILSINEINVYGVDDEKNRKNLRTLVRKLLPGFVLLDRSDYLEQHFQKLHNNNTDAELFDAWLDFIALKQKARPKYNLIQRHLIERTESNPEDEKAQSLLGKWQKHLEQPYEQQSIPDELSNYFSNSAGTKNKQNLLAQWQIYLEPHRPTHDLLDGYINNISEDDTLICDWKNHLNDPYYEATIPERIIAHFSELDKKDKALKVICKQWKQYIKPTQIDAIWEYVEKPNQGFLVPIMTGYKAISQVYENHEVANTRDHKTDVCFVEAVHSIGEWKGVHHIKKESTLQRILWHYHYEPNWYLCKQNLQDTQLTTEQEEIRFESPDDDFSEHLT